MTSIVFLNFVNVMERKAESEKNGTKRQINVLTPAEENCGRTAVWLALKTPAFVNVGGE